MTLAMNHQPAIRPATYQDVIDAPADKVAEIVAGSLYLHPRPRLRHSHASIGAVGFEMIGAFQKGRGGPGGWWILIEPEIHLGDDVLVPDVVGWRRERLPVLPKDDAFATLAPDWVCEVLSPSTRTFDLTTKRAAYAAHGVEHLWLDRPRGPHRGGLPPRLRRLDPHRRPRRRRRGPRRPLRRHRLLPRRPLGGVTFTVP